MEWTFKLFLWPLWTHIGGLDVCTCTNRCTHPTLLQDSRATQIPSETPCLFLHCSLCINVHIPPSHLKIQSKENDSMTFMSYSVPEIPLSCFCSHFPWLWKELRVALLLLNVGLGKVWVLIWTGWSGADDRTQWVVKGLTDSLMAWTQSPGRT